MALIHRISKLFTADLHAVLDRLEEPETLLKQAVRDMEEAFEAAEQRTKRLEHRRVDLTRRGEALAGSIAGVDEDLDLCLAHGEEALARSLVRKKLEAERAGRHVAAQLEALERELGEQRRMLDEQQRELDGMRQKAELFAPSCRAEAGGTETCVGNDEVEVALLREKQRRAVR